MGSPQKSGPRRWWVKQSPQNPEGFQRENISFVDVWVFVRALYVYAHLRNGKPHFRTLLLYGKAFWMSASENDPFKVGRVH